MTDTTNRPERPKVWHPTDRPNFYVVEYDGKRVAFSYETIVAFGTPWRVTTNNWGPTTGKHLNWLDTGWTEAKRDRLAADDFSTALDEYLATS